MSEAPLTIPPEEPSHEISASTEPSPALIEAAAVPRRRVTLMTLLVHDELTLTDLATRVAAREFAVTVGDVTASQRRRVLTSLHHVHLPKLDDEEFVVRERDGEDRLVRGAERLDEEPAFDVVEAALAGDWSEDVVATLLADSRRRDVITLLRGIEGAQSVDELARDVLALADEGDGAPSEEAVSSEALSLHHSHLPKLDDAGVVDYDPAEGRVSLETVPPVYETLTHGRIDG